MAVIGGTQPDRLSSLLVKGDDDGLLARFLVVFPDPVPISRPTSAINTVQLKEAFNRLRSLPPKIDENGKDCPANVSFDEAAITRFQEFRVTCREWEGQALGCYKSHLGKLPGHVVRVACVLAHLDYAANPFVMPPSQIGKDMVERAAYLVGDHLRLHAFRAYGAMQDAPEIRSARKLAKVIMDETLGRVTVREIQRRKLADLGTALEISTALGVLERFDWVRVETETTQGRPRKFWIANPRLGEAQRHPTMLRPSDVDRVTEGAERGGRGNLSPSVTPSKGSAALKSMPIFSQPQQKE